jgi:hypothetical protein
MNYLVTFKRIGRHEDRAIEIAEGDPAQMAADLAAAIRKRRYLTSRWFDVTVDLDAGKVWVEGGRFGTGVIQRIKLEDVKP